MADQRQHLAGARIHGDNRAVAIAKCQLGRALDVDVDGQLQALAAGRRLLAQSPHLAAVAVHDHVARAVLAHAASGRTSAPHPICRPRRPACNRRSCRVVEHVFAHLADVANQVGGKAVPGIETPLLVNRFQLRQLVAMCLDKRLLVRGDVLLQRQMADKSGRVR